MQIVKIRDEHETVLAEKDFPFEFEKEYPIVATVSDNRIQAKVADVIIDASDNEYREGGVALVIYQGSLSTDAVTITPPL